MTGHGVQFPAKGPAKLPAAHWKQALFDPEGEANPELHWIHAPLVNPYPALLFFFLISSVRRSSSQEVRRSNYQEITAPLIESQEATPFPVPKKTKSKRNQSAVQDELRRLNW